MYPGIFDESFADFVWQSATAMLPFLFAVLLLILIWKLLKSVLPL